MNVVIEWEGGVPEQLASIYAAMAGDGEALLRAARFDLGDGVVNGVIADSMKKVRRVEDILDDCAPPTPPPPQPPSPFLNLAEACALCGLQPRTLRNLLHENDAGLIAARLPGKAYRFHRERFQKWVEHRPEYARLPGVKKRRRR